jgi:hypothetical protein
MNKVQYYEIIEPAVAIVVKKHQDYNNDSLGLESYFPLGDQIYVQMLHVKTQRLVGLVKEGNKPNFESARDTVLDLINYAVFYLDYMNTEHKL